AIQQGDSEIAEAWFDQAAEYWKQAIALTPAIGALVFAALMLFAGWFHYHKAAPKLAWLQM
ncbi:hypothetical protein HAX54_015764, partial [Datura stramonium]|nr:hypothetical protein [Datura stramonium]